MAFELFKAKDANQDNQIKMGLNEVSWSFLKKARLKAPI
jgi:hypothetical protein